MTQLYEGMFVLDNAVVRQGWKAAKAIVTDILAKHEAKTITARRWDERKLAYSIKGRGRATFMLSYFELAKDAGPALSRSLELNESVLRYLITRVDSLPVTEAELAAREDSDDFVVPAPPVESAPVVAEEVEEEPVSEDAEVSTEELPEGLAVDAEAADEVAEDGEPAEKVAALADASDETKTDEGA